MSKQDPARTQSAEGRAEDRSPAASDASEADSTADAAALRSALYRIIGARRDIRHFRRDPVSDDVLRRILEAAHQAASVGFMQPWDFILIRSAQRKTRIYRLFQEANARAAKNYRGDRAERYGALKLQGLLDAPVLIAVTCDTRRGGPHVLGRDTIPETDVYSTCLAIQNLWLAACAEGLGVGWVSIVDNDRLSRMLELPEGVIPVATLCLGFPLERPGRPMLESTGWRQRLDLNGLLHEETWGRQNGFNSAGSGTEAGEAGPAVREPSRRKAAPEEDGEILSRVERLIQQVGPIGEDGRRAALLAKKRQDSQVKPHGSLDEIEASARRLASIQRTASPSVARREALIFAADHGIRNELLPGSRSGTIEFCCNCIAGGSVLNSLCRSLGVGLTLVDVGVDHDFEGAAGIVHRKVSRGTASWLSHDAMTRRQAASALLAGAQSVEDLQDAQVLALAEIAPSGTASAAALAALVTGTPSDLFLGDLASDGESARCRRLLIRRGVERCRSRELDPLGQLAALGGLELAAMAGAMLAAAARRLPAVIDGLSGAAAALLAKRLAPHCNQFLIASQRPRSEGHALVLEQLGLKPLLVSESAAGQEMGALMTIPLLDVSCRLLAEVRTFEEANLEDFRRRSGRD